MHIRSWNAAVDLLAMSCAALTGSWGCSKLNNYNDFVRLLDATRSFTVGGEQLRIWLGLNPPTEAVVPGVSLRTGDCNIPTDSPLTP